MDKFSALLAICAGNTQVNGEFPAQNPVTRNFDVFFDLHLNRRLSKQSWGWWIETLLCPLWCHCNVPQPQILHPFVWCGCNYISMPLNFNDSFANVYEQTPLLINRISILDPWSLSLTMCSIYMFMRRICIHARVPYFNVLSFYVI